MKKKFKELKINIDQTRKKKLQPLQLFSEYILLKLLQLLMSSNLQLLKLKNPKA